MDRNAIVLENVSLTFTFITQRSMKEEILGLIGLGNSSKSKKIRAVNDVSLNIEKGKTVGIIGKNGSGKTTLLRIMAGIYAPDAGKLTINTEKVSLLSLGVGFDNELSGYENIYLTATLQGHKKENIDKVVNEIIEFSELGDFIHNPIKTYSSGMRSRLAFSIAVQFKPDILLVDEVLSVGDEGFKQKSFEKAKELIRDGRRTVVIVSHNAQHLRDFCDEAIWIHEGSIKLIGEPNEVLQQYNDFIRSNR